MTPPANHSHDPETGEPLDRSPRRFLRVAAVVIVLFLPVFIIFGLRYCSTPHFGTLPIYGEREARASGDTLYHTLPAVDSLTAHTGAPWTTDSMRGRIHVADFIFTNCPGICRKLSAGFEELQPQLQYAWDQRGDVRLVSYTVDPARDSLSALQAYAQRYNAHPGLWTFVRAPKGRVQDVAMRGYLVPLQLEGGAEDGITHTEMLVLVDPDLRIRGFYNGLDPADRKRLQEEIKVLRHEYRLKQEQTGQYPRFAK